MPRITEKTQPIDRSSISIPPNIKLADPTLHRSSNIHLLLGAKLFYNLLCVGQITKNKADPVMQKTQLSWIISGAVPVPQQSFSSCHISIKNNDLHNEI